MKNLIHYRNKRIPRNRGFTLIEMIFVVSIVSLLAAIAVPAFFTVQGQARQISCGSNLRQIGMALLIYSQDHEGYYPYAVDPGDKFTPQIWSEYPEFQSQIPDIGLIQDVLSPYMNSPQLFHCPADVGFDVNDFTYESMPARPTSFERYRTSYYYRTELTVRRANDSSLKQSAQVNVLFDGAGLSHGTLMPLMQRYNVLFADGHVKNLNRMQIDETWDTPL